MKANDERVQNFLARLTQLTQEMGIVIGGCGCCGSPYLTVASTESIKSGEYRVGDEPAEEDANVLTWKEQK